MGGELGFEGFFLCDLLFDCTLFFGWWGGGCAWFGFVFFLFFFGVFPIGLIVLREREKKRKGEGEGWVYARTGRLVGRCMRVDGVVGFCESDRLDIDN